MPEPVYAAISTVALERGMSISGYVRYMLIVWAERRNREASGNAAPRA